MRGIAFDVPDYAAALGARRLAALDPAARARRRRARSTRPTRATCSRSSTARSTAASRGEFDAMVTAPVQKSVINDAGIAFTGHTEYLAERTGTPRVVMMLVGGGLRVALATTHLALAEVPRAITRERLEAIAAHPRRATCARASASRGRASSSRA